MSTKVEQVISFVSCHQESICDINRKVDESAMYTKELLGKLDQLLLLSSGDSNKRKNI